MIHETLCAVLDNQEARTDAALENLRDEIFVLAPGGDCSSIRAIGEHLLKLRGFQLTLLESPFAEEAPQPAADEIPSPKALRDMLATGAALVRRAITARDPDDWFRTPDPPRPVRWGDEPSMVRFLRPMNDFTNHLGAIRAIRRIHGNAAERTQ